MDHNHNHLYSFKSTPSNTYKKDIYIFNMKYLKKYKRVVKSGTQKLKLTFVRFLVMLQKTKIGSKKIRW
jgi:hypothetical protein